MTSRKLDVGAAWHCWRMLKPHIVMVDMAGLAIYDSRVRGVELVDPDDTGTAALAVTLGLKVLSKDNHLLDQGLAVGDSWLEMAFAVKHAAIGEAADGALAMGVVVPAYAVTGAYEGLQSAWASPVGRRVLTGVGIGLLLVVVGFFVFAYFKPDFRERLKTQAKDAGRFVAEGGKVVISGYAETTVKKIAAYAVLSAAAVAPLREPTHIDVAIRILARSHSAVSTYELARRIWDYERVTTPALAFLESELRKYPAFVEVAPGQWTFGQPLLAATSTNLQLQDAIPGNGPP